MNICIKDSFFFLFWTLSSSLINCLCGELFILRAVCGLCFDVQWKVFRKFCPLCYKQVIALSPRRIKDKFSLVFSKFSQIALVATRLGQFCENFENTRENLSLILLGLMRLHIQIKWYAKGIHGRKATHDYLTGQKITPMKISLLSLVGHFNTSAQCPSCCSR